MNSVSGSGSFATGTKHVSQNPSGTKSGRLRGEAWSSGKASGKAALPRVCIWIVRGCGMSARDAGAWVDAGSSAFCACLVAKTTSFHLSQYQWGPLWISRNLLDPIFLLILHASELRNDLPRLRTQSNRTDDIDI